MLRKITGSLIAFILIFTMIPTFAFAAESAEMSDEFKAILNEDGELELDCAPPSNDDEAIFMVCEPFYAEHEWKFGIDDSTFNDDYTSAEVRYYGDDEFGEEERHTVKINYNYDADVNARVDELADNMSGKYVVSDLEIVNYLVNNGKEEGLIYYSGAFKECFDYTNISFEISERAGDDFPLLIRRIGVGTVSYEDTSYAVLGHAEAAGHFVLYVPDETEDSSDAMLEAAQKRVNEYLGNNGNFKLSYAGKITDVWSDALYDAMYHDMSDSPQTYDEWFDEYVKPYENDYLGDVVNELGVDGDTDVYEASVKGKTYPFLILRDSSKMLNPEYKGKHIRANVEIAADSSEVPLDSFVEADILSGGEEYDRIHSVLDAEDSLSYDLGLYSGSLGENVTKLENGKFLVKIPVPAELEGRDLVVYYVDAENNVTEHEVTVEDGYATFETDHFSIYTLAAKAVVEDQEEPVEDEDDAAAAEDNEEPKDSEETKDNEAVEEASGENAPATGDHNSIVIWTTVALLSIIAFAGMYRKREE